MDFVHDQLATGTRIRILTIVDTFSRFSPAIVPRPGFRAPDVIAVLEQVGREIGLPRTIRVDQGSEFISRDLDLWAYQRDVTFDFSRPGKPTDNAFIESLNGKTSSPISPTSPPSASERPGRCGVDRVAALVRPAGGGHCRNARPAERPRPCPVPPPSACPSFF
ncbi:transposase family protein [Paracoccus sp. MC1862]|nr:transposase family protein [Paracoccus sp. MC1862]QQO43944.1 transposase family protein [Paracoccus sp. MC1862]